MTTIQTQYQSAETHTQNEGFNAQHSTLIRLQYKKVLLLSHKSLPADRSHQA